MDNLGEMDVPHAPPPRPRHGPSHHRGRAAQRPPAHRRPARRQRRRAPVVLSWPNSCLGDDLAGQLQLNISPRPGKETAFRASYARNAFPPRPLWGPSFTLKARVVTIFFNAQKYQKA